MRSLLQGRQLELRTKRVSNWKRRLLMVTTTFFWHGFESIGDLMDSIESAGKWNREPHNYAFKAYIPYADVWETAFIVALRLEGDWEYWFDGGLIYLSRTPCRDRNE